jgi:GTP-binding protein
MMEHHDTKMMFRKPCVFFKGVVNLGGLPNTGLPEVAFAGRSNVGKSSLVNAVVKRRDIARTSNTPGRTREINFFTACGGAFYLVDMPGYGYAKAPKAQVAGWNRLIADYLKGRAELVRVFLLIDARHGIRKKDVTVMDLMDKAAASYQVVLTKIDKLKLVEQSAIMEKTENELKMHPAAHPMVVATSARKALGIEELQVAITEAALV